MKREIRQICAVWMISLLSVATIFPAFAEEEEVKNRGWQQEEDGRWFYLDSSGERKTDTWIRGADRNRYYLDEEGYMATDRIIENGNKLYYVDKNGVRVTNRWASQSNAEEICDQEVDTVWYYIGADGSAKRKENHAYHIRDKSGELQKYFFDSDGHMLTGWQKIENHDGNYDIYYLGDENEGYVHTQWQYLIPPDDEDEILTDPTKVYDGYEMFYFGWDGKMKRSDECEIENGQRFGFDENGVMITGWAPAVHPDNPNGDEEEDGKNFGVNRYYDKVTGIMAKGWLFASDPDSDESSDPHWFYCDKKDGYLYNEGGRDSDSVLGWKKIDGQVYFFDDHGRMVTGLISTGGNDTGGSPFVESEFDYLENTGVIGKGGSSKPAGIYYLSQNEATLGQMAKGTRIRLSLDGDSETYHFHKAGWAYTNALVEDRVYGEDGVMLCSEGGWEVFPMDRDIYDKEDFREEDGEIVVKAGAEPLIRAGEAVMINKSGKIKKKGRVKVEGIRYEVTDYVAVECPDED